MNKHRVLIYHDHYNGWSIFCNEHLYQLGFISWGDELQSMCNQYCKQHLVSFTMEGWEL